MAVAPSDYATPNRWRQRLARLSVRITTPGHWLAIAPTAFLLAFFVAPVLRMVTLSFYKFHPTRLVIREFTTENYLAVINDAFVRDILLRTVRLSLLATLCCAVLGFIIALRMRQARGFEKMLLALIVLSPLMMSPVILGYAWVVILAPNTGLLKALFEHFGQKAPRIMFTETGALIGLTYANLVYMVLSVHAAVENIEDSLLRAAEVHGASPLETFYRVTLPLALPGIVSGSLLVFAISSSSFLMPYLLGGRQTPVLATYAYDMATTVLNWPSAGAIAGVLVIITSGIMYLYSTWVHNTTKRSVVIDEK